MSDQDNNSGKTGWSNTAGRTAIAARLRRVRLDRGLSQQDLALAAGMHRTHLVRFEGGKVNLTLDAFCALACSLQVEPRELMPSLAELECQNNH